MTLSSRDSDPFALNQTTAEVPDKIHLLGVVCIIVLHMSLGREKSWYSWV